MLKCLNNKGEESPSYTKGFSSEFYNARTKNSGFPVTGNNLEYRDLKNFNWIKDKLNPEPKVTQKLERPCTRGGEKRGLDFSFIDKDNNNDLAAEGSYFDRPVTRSKPRRPVSRQVRLNKRVNNLRVGRVDSESYRGGGELGDWEPTSFKESINVHKIQKVIPESAIHKPSQEGASSIKIINKESFLDRKRSLRDSTSLDPNLKVNKSINFNRKNSNGENSKDSNYKNSSINNQFIIGELNRSIESIQIKDKSDTSSMGDSSSNFKNFDKIKGKISIFKDSNGVRLLRKKGKDHKNWYSPSLPKNNKNELYCIQEEKEANFDKNKAGVYDSFVSTTQDTKDHKIEEVYKKMKHTDGFLAFKASIGEGNTSNSLLPSSSGDTIINR